ncbi:bifunctional DNA primase/polymerase [Streptomyces albicerus]|uniref:bifunctional DNA primase/polymerase n=1 Tax=Streptomyces albicerus TaxID=2569859 RepID=UPI00124B74FB|nr:bifunctional DNA primase/polymerase [Streptomyces albicerus]
MSNHDKARAAALHAAREWGHEVFPLSIHKTPIIRSPHEKGHSCPGRAFCGWWGHGVGDSSNDSVTINEGFDQAPKAVGYGTACNNMIGLDLDKKNGVDGVATLNRLAAEHGFKVPRTTTVCTPSGGFHLWLAIPEGIAVPNSVGRLGPGIDVRSSRGYVVGPGSIGRAGEYVLHPKVGYIEPQPIPEQLLTLMLPPAPRQQPQRRMAAMSVDSSTRALQGLVDVVLKSSQGNRNSALYWAASKAWAHVGDGHVAAADVEAELIGAAIQIGLSEAEAHRTVASAGRGAGVTA